MRGPIQWTKALPMQAYVLSQKLDFKSMEKIALTCASPACPARLPGLVIKQHSVPSLSSEVTVHIGD